ncbi:hypothetical protein ACI7RC_04010 [Brevibacillus sp. B_LB10_24]|uniref:hypothetical protein n=1 Tax=Brevibacillus sp. B_LB10_24 TaxID=3380645 RepID=UPI0038B757F8
MPRIRLLTACFAVMLILAGLAGNAGAAAAEDGFYLGGEDPVYITADDCIDHLDQVLAMINERDLSEVYFVQAGLMANFIEILDAGGLGQALYPVRLDSLQPRYVRFADGSTLIIDGRSTQEPPEVDFIR